MSRIGLKEPTSSLDAENMLIIASLIKELKQNNKIVLLTKHDLQLFNKAIDRFVVIQEGTIVTHKNTKGSELS